MIWLGRIMDATFQRKLLLGVCALGVAVSGWAEEPSYSRALVPRSLSIYGRFAHSKTMLSFSGPRSKGLLSGTLVPSLNASF